MQSKALSLLSAAAALVALSVPSSGVETEPICYTDLPSNINCSPAKSIEDIQQFLRNLAASNVIKDIKYFYLLENNHIQHLPAGLLEGFRFEEIYVNFNPQLHSADDFIGTSGALVARIQMMNNALTALPALSAPNLVNLSMYQDTPMAVSRNSFRGMANVEKISFSNIRLGPNAFLDLKNLKFLEVTDMPNEAVAPGAFHFASPVLEWVTLQTNRGWKGQAQPGAYDGFVNGSLLWITESTELPRDVYFNVLNSGASLKIFEPLDCDCKVAWLRLSPLLSNAVIRCRRGSSIVTLESMPEENYTHCPPN